jgi:NADH-quinone oxidoreductase subunit N
MLQKFQNNLQLLYQLFPEICLAFLVVILLVMAAFSASPRKCFGLFSVGMLANAGLIGLNYSLFAPFELLFCGAIWAAGLLALREKQTLVDGVFFALLAAITLGMQMPLLSNNLLLLYLSLEVVSICSYLLVTFKKDKRATEAAIKYFLFGATASGMMLYGMTWLYGFSNSLEISIIAEKSTAIPALPFYTACLLTLVGLLFKIVVAPLHAWVTDVYEGSATNMIFLLTAASKAFGISILCLFVYFFAKQPQILSNFSIFLQVLAIVSLIFGTFGAIWQKNTKRLLAYSSIIHSGFLLVFLVVLLLPTTTQTLENQAFITQIEKQSVFAYLAFYLLVYFLLNYLILYALTLLENNKQPIDLQDFTGLGKSQFWFGFALLVAFAGLAGLPPTAGFTAKLLVFTALIEGYVQHKTVLLLVLLLVLSLASVVALFFYVKIPYFLFFGKEPNHNLLIFNNLDKFILLLLALAGLALFFVPNLIL